MFYKGKPVVCYSLHHVLKSFRKWLTYLKKRGTAWFCVMLWTKLHECFSGFCDTLDFFRAILPNQEKFSLEYLVSHSEKFIQRSWCSGGFQSVTETHWVASSCSWCPLFKSYNWCIKYLWYFVLAIPSQTVSWNFETTSFTPHNFWKHG